MRKTALTTLDVCIATVVPIASLLCVTTGCTSNLHVSTQRQKAIKCAANWKTAGYDFDPNTMTCSQMYEKVSAIRRAKHWKDKGYDFDPNSMTWAQMDQEVTDIDRARYWHEQGYEFDPTSMTAVEMDQRARELLEADWWKSIGYYYDPNSKTVFLDESKKTKLSSLAGIHAGGSGWPASTFSYPTVSWPKTYSYQSNLPTYHLPPVAENESYYGQISESTGRPKTVYVRGYYRKDGTYVRSHYRSPPRK